MGPWRGSRRRKNGLISYDRERKREIDHGNRERKREREECGVMFAAQAPDRG